ncbi:hypothetical protein BDW72DRAFT_205640 [Aspergillus terricola var. indicus]
MGFFQSTQNESPSSSPELPSADYKFESQDALAQLVKEPRGALECRQQSLQQDETGGQYVVFTSVPPAQSSKLTGNLIAKIIPDSAHQFAIRSFDLLVHFQLRAMDVHHDMVPLGSTTVTIGYWKNEADCCWAPALTDTRLSFVMEVGLSESQRQLSLIARSWLQPFSSSVKLVVTIRPSPPSARCTAFLKLTRTDIMTSVTGESYTNGTTTTTTQLELPFDKIVGRPPRHPLERDLVIPEQELRIFGEKIWSTQRFL